MIEDKCFILQIDSLFWNDTVIVRFIKDILKINGMIFPEIICMHLHNYYRFNHATSYQANSWNADSAAKRFRNIIY